MPWHKEILSNFYGKIPRSVIMERLPGFTYNSIKAQAASLGLIGNRKLVQSMARRGKGKKYKVNQQFFDKTGQLQSYWAGFIAADGCLNAKKNCVSIRLNAKDRIHLENFKKAVEYTGPIRDVKPYGISNAQVLLQCHSVSEWIESLNYYYSLTPNKSLTLMPPKHLSNDNIWSYIAGYIDGDGSISISPWRIQLIGTKALLSWIKGHFDIAAPSDRKLAQVIKSKKCKQYLYSVSSRRAEKILSMISNRDVPLLERKWKIIKGKLWDNQ